MTISRATGTQVVKVIKTYMDLHTAARMFAELEQIDGNASFRQSVKMISKMLEDQS